MSTFERKNNLKSLTDALNDINKTLKNIIKIKILGERVVKLIKTLF